MSSVLLRRTQGGYQSHNRTGLLTLHRRDDLARAYHANDLDTASLDCLSSALFSIDERQYPHYDSPLLSSNFNRSESRAAGCDDILDNRNTVTGNERPLDQLSGTMGFHLLAHGEGFQRLVR